MKVVLAYGVLGYLYLMIDQLLKLIKYKKNMKRSEESLAAFLGGSESDEQYVHALRHAHNMEILKSNIKKIHFDMFKATLVGAIFVFGLSWILGQFGVVAKSDAVYGIIYIIIYEISNIIIK